MRKLLNWFRLAAGVGLMVCACLAPAQTGSVTPPSGPVGLWRAIDDNTGKAKALVRITESGGEYTGRIEKIFPGVTPDADPTCDRCEGARKDQRVLGMVILSGLRRDPNPNTEEYNGGEILDPQNGSVYHALLTLVDGGKKLRVRGYIGVTLFGRTQVWERDE